MLEDLTPLQVQRELLGNAIDTPLPVGVGAAMRFLGATHPGRRRAGSRPKGGFPRTLALRKCLAQLLDLLGVLSLHRRQLFDGRREAMHLCAKVAKGARRRRARPELHIHILTNPGNI